MGVGTRWLKVVVVVVGRVGLIQKWVHLIREVEVEVVVVFSYQAPAVVG